MQIYDINDNLIYDAPLTEGCERVQELMAADHIQLSFKAVHSFTIPAGAYIDWFGIYRLLEPYTPTQQSEAEYLYTPQFHAEHITWKKYPFFFYTDKKAEPDWSLTGNATLFLDCVIMALQKTFGQSWHYSVASDLPASAYVAFQNTDIFSGLNAIAEAFKTEWYADLTENRIYLGHVSRDEQAVLEVGKNVNVPSVTANSDAYFNRFYAFGSTRNIPQNYVGANTQNVVNKRLTLDPAKYPDGYKDIKDLKSGEEFATNLFFDNIYPRATEGTEGSKGLAISNVRERRLFKVERGTTNRIPTGETDENGNPIYEMYSIWYFNIASLEFSKSMIIEGTDLTCSFESGALQGREFVLGYHEEGQKLETADGTPFYVYAGDYEILYVEENGITIPTTGVGLIPADGDEVALFNLKLPDSYVEIAYKELEAALDEEIARRQKDYNSYTFKSNPVAFAKNNPNLYLGRAVKLINSGNALDTRITKLTYKLDSESPLFPNEMTITIGEKRIKGSIATLKEEVVNANRNIDLLATLNKQTTTIQEAYKRTQDAILQGFNRIANMWQFDDEGNVFSEFNVYTLKALSTKGISANEGGTGGTGVDLSAVWVSLSNNTDAYGSAKIHLDHIPTLTKSKISDFPTIISAFANDAGYITASAIINKADKATTLAGYGITDAVKYCYGADDIRHSASGYALITHGGKVNGMLLSGIYKETSLYGGQLNGAFDGSSIWYRGLNNGAFTEWKRIAFTDDVVTLNTNQTISGVKTLSANLLSATRGTLDIGDEYNSFNRIFAWHYKPNSLTKPILSSGKWYRIWNFSQGVAGTFQKNAIISINKAYNYEQGQTITLAVSINNWGQTYVINQLSGTTGLIIKVRVTGKWNYSYVDVYISSAENAESYSVSGYGNGERVDFEELADDATNDSTRTEELTVVNGTAVNYPLSLQNATPLVVNSTTMVANLNANYLGGLNKNSFQKAVYDYINVSGTADTTALPTVLAPCNYNGTSVIGTGNFNFYDTKFFNGQSNTSNRCQLAYGYDHDTIAFRRFSGGEWKSWKTVAFTDVDSLTPNSGQLSIIGAMQVNSAFRVLGEVDLSSMVRTNSTTGVLDLDGNYIDVYAPMNVKTSLNIGQATISWDSVNGMLKVNTGAYFTGPVSTKGVSGGSGLVAVAQFGITWHDAWAIDADSTYVESFGTTTKSISEGQSITNGSTITIVSDAFAGKKIGDIEIFTLGWENEAPANVRLAPYKISGNTLYCSLLLSGTMTPTTFKIKIY